MLQKVKRRLNLIFNFQIQYLRKVRIIFRLVSTFLLVAIIPLGIVAMYSFYNSYLDAKEKVGFYTSQITRQSAANIDLQLDNYDDIAKRLVNSNEVQNHFRNVNTKNELDRFKVDDELINLLSAQMSKNVAFDGITLMHNSGMYEVHVGNKFVPKNYLQTDLYKNSILNKGKALWLEPHYSEGEVNTISKHEKMITFSEEIKGKWDGSPIGVLVISIKPASFKKVFEGMELWKDGKISIINSEGKYIYNEDEKLLGERLTDSLLTTQINRFVNQNTNQYFDYNVDKTKVLVSCTKLINNDWIVASVLSYSNLLKKTTNILAFTLFIIVLCIVISIYISLVVSYSISHPINKLMKAVNKIENGDFEIQVDTSGNDEIQHLNVSYKRMVDKINDLINELYKAKIVHQQIQIKALKAQINPHFLYNTLETISSIAKIRKIKEISSIAQGLSSMFRYSIKTGSDIIKLSSEIENVKNYLSILKIRYEEKLDYEFTIPSELNNYKTYKLILQPIVENAVHHGIELKKDRGLIKIEAFIHNNYLHIRISDNGVGIEEQALRKLQEKLLLKDVFMDEKISEGIGITNVNARLALYYKENYQFNISSVFGKGTDVEIVIPAEVYEEDSNV